MLNNPLSYTDPSGEIIPLLIIGAVVGAYIGGVQANGTWNPFKWNWKSGSTWLGIGGGAVLGAAAAGAGAGIAASLAVKGTTAFLSASLGGAVAGIIQGGGFAVLPGGDGNVLKGASIGALSGFVGGGLGNIANNAVNNVMVNGIGISSPVVKGLIGGAAGGAVGGYSGGFVGGFISTGDLSLAHKAGIGSVGIGATIGAISGGATQYALAKQQGIKPWSGVRNNSVMIGGPQIKVDNFANDFNSETITNNNRFGEWPNGMKAFLGQNSPNPEALLFNSKFINNVIDSNSPIYNIGRSSNSVFYHGIELNTINLRSYNNINFVRTYAPFSSFKLRFSTYD